MPSGRRVDSGSRRFTGSRQVFAGFILVRMGSLKRAWGSPGSFACALVHSVALMGCRVHWVSRGFTRVRIGVVGFIRVRLGLHSAHRGGRVHSGALSAPTVFIHVHVCSLVHALVSTGSSWVHSGARSGRLVYSVSRGFIRACVGVAGSIRIPVDSLGHTYW